MLNFILDYILNLKKEIGDDYFFILIIITLIMIISLILYIIKSLSKKKLDYHLNEFWERRYSLYNREIDWYINFNKICEDFELIEKFNEFLPYGKKSKFLELGCGNSSLANDMYDYGYKNITALDFSITVIEKMKKKYPNKSIKCKYFF
jgi:2-polyprenyl-3-methyl-5-hydroxy-6-metoxy-1,4-benzoquinol methylase